MRHDEASNTTQGPARLRAAHQFSITIRRSTWIRSPWADSRVGPSIDPRRRAVDTQPPVTLLRSAFVLRARYTEDCLAKPRSAARRSTSFWAQDWIPSLIGSRLCEGDANLRGRPSGNAGLERGCLARRGIVPPENLAFVAVDFERDGLAESLAPTGSTLRNPRFFPG